MHLYVHVPFCARRCSYCDFSIAVRRRVPAAEYLEAVARELRATPAGEPLATLYLGGGTPSRLPPAAVADLVGLVRAHWPLAPDAEVTLEANPEDVTASGARQWRASGVNRVSLGAQSFDDGVLRWMHRAHDARRIGDAMTLLRDAGIANLSLDLIFALPAALRRDWDRDLEHALALTPSHLSLYGLTIEERTPLARWVARGAVRPTDDDRYAAEYLRAHARLAPAGLTFYEVSNAARPGQRSRHNQAYWTGVPYRGLGPAAHSFDGRTRRWNLAAWEAYRRALLAGRSPVEHEETLSDEQQALERVYLALRTVEGLELTGGRASRLRQPPTAWLDRGWVELAGGRVRCTPEGWLRLDALVADLTGSVPNP